MLCTHASARPHARAPARPRAHALPLPRSRAPAPPRAQGWKKYVDATVAGLSGVAQKKGERFMPMHNTARIYNHWRRCHLRKHLRKWQIFAHPRFVMRALEGHHATKRARWAFGAWCDFKTWSNRQKSICLGEWKDYCTRLIQRPFRAWYVWAHERRTRETTRRAVVSAFQRRRRYNKKYQIFKLWKHLAVFGKVEGLKSRVALIKALEEQNAFAMALEDTIDKLQDELEVSETAVKDQEAINKKQLEQQAEVDLQYGKQQARLHSTEQEIVRLQSIIDALTVMYPNTVDQLGEAKRKKTKLGKQQAKAAARNPPPPKEDGEPSLPPPKTRDNTNHPDLRPFVRLRVKERLGGEEDEEEERDPEEVAREAAAAEAAALKAEAEALENLMIIDDDEPSPTNKSGKKLGAGGASPVEDVPDDGALSDEDLQMLYRLKFVLHHVGLGPAPAQGEQPQGQMVDSLDDVESDGLLAFVGTGVLKSTKYFNPSRDNWGDFLSTISMMHGMKHVLNTSAKDKLQTRIAQGKARFSNKKNTPILQGPQMNLYSETKAWMDKEGEAKIEAMMGAMGEVD